ncbi:MAG TPA: calcium-binding protein [Microvirga sp.]|jgi:Ca2+-binding RTX toxin-like protein
MVSSPFTPTIWAAQQQFNPTAAGTQNDPKAVALSNGNFLVVWEESGSAVIAPSPGTDLVGQIYDALGNPVGSEFRVNDTFTEDTETNVSLAALADGGFAAVYVDTDASGSSIRVDTFDASGNRVPGPLVTIQADDGADALGDPHVAVNPDGSYLVVYERFVSPTEHKIMQRFVSAAGLVSSETEVELDADGAQLGGLVRLANGSYVVSFADDAGPESDPAFRIISSAGVVGGSVFVNSGLNDQTDVQVAALAGGGFVMVWQEDNIDGAGEGIRARIYDATGTAVSAIFTVNATTVGDQNEPTVTALQDGGFLVAWDDDTAGVVRAQRFDATGTPQGTEFLVGDSTSETTPVLATLSDGRVLFAFDSDEILGSIFDPRGPIVNGTAGADVIAGRVDGGLVNGLAGNDRITGLGAADLIDGGPGADSMTGGGGNDTYRVDDAGDLVTELPGGGTDLVEAAISYALTAEVENLTLIASAANGTGNGLANAITGNDLNNELSGGAGADQLLGLGGSDRLDGGADNDVLTGGLARDFLTGGAGRDLFDYNASNETGKTGASRDQILDFKRGQDDIDLRTIDASTKKGGNQAFKFIGENGFSNTAGELRINDLGTNVIVQVDRNGDGRVDFEILVRGVGTMVKGDFLL